MKPNSPHYWTITLYGASVKGRVQVSQIHHRGDIQSAFGAADEQECEVDWEVVQFIITRGEKADH